MQSPMIDPKTSIKRTSKSSDLKSDISCKQEPSIIQEIVMEPVVKRKSSDIANHDIQVRPAKRMLSFDEH